MLGKLIACTLLVSISLCSINIALTANHDTCFTIAGGQDYRLEYLISGVNETNAEFRLTRSNDPSVLLLFVNNRSDYSQTIPMPEGLVDLCFSSGDNQHKMLSIEFFPTSDPVKGLITKRQIKSVYSELNKLETSLQQSYRNQQFQSERDIVHRQVLEQTETHIKWLGVGKVFLLLTSALVQVWIMKGFLKNKAQPYQPVN